MPAVPDSGSCSSSSRLSQSQTTAAIPNKGSLVVSGSDRQQIVTISYGWLFGGYRLSSGQFLFTWYQRVTICTMNHVMGNWTLVPAVGNSNDRSWFQRRLGLPDLLVRYQYLQSEIRHYNFGPVSIAFAEELCRIREMLQKLENSAYQLDFQRLYSSVPYDDQIRSLEDFSHSIRNRILALHEMLFREEQNLIHKINSTRPSVIVPNPGYSHKSFNSGWLNNERIASNGLYSSSSEPGTPVTPVNGVKPRMADGYGGHASVHQYQPNPMVTAGPNGPLSNASGSKAGMSGMPDSGTSSACIRSEQKRYRPYKASFKSTFPAPTMTTFSHFANGTDERNLCFGIHSAGGCHICTNMPSQFESFLQVPPPAPTPTVRIVPKVSKPVRERGVVHLIPDYVLDAGSICTTNSIALSTPPFRHNIATTKVTWTTTNPICSTSIGGR